MSDFDAFRFSFSGASAEQKLAILRSGSFRRLPVIQGFAELLRRALEQPVIEQSHEEMKEWLSNVIVSAQNLRDLIDAVTSLQNREGRGLPELRPYESLADAIQETAQKLSLPLAKAIDDPSRILVHNQYPLVLLDVPKYHRELSFVLVESGYSVDLLSFRENHIFQVEHCVLLSTLEDVSMIINQWLVEQRPLEELQRLYPLSKNGG